MPENRKHKREFKSLPIRVLVAHAGEGRYMEMISHNLSASGVSGDIYISERSWIESLISNQAASIEIISGVGKPSVVINASLVRYSIVSGENRVKAAFKFQTELRDKIIINHSHIESKKPNGLETVGLLINGEDVDTGNYEFFPYTDKCIQDFKTCFRLIQELKKGNFPPGYHEYIRARYCVATDESNLKCIDSAFEAYRIFSKFPLQKRRDILEGVHRLLIIEKENIVERLISEGHSRRLAEWEFEGMERGLSHETLDFYVSEIEKTKICNNERIQILRRGDGVVCVSPPKNAPCSNSLIAVLSLLVGNTLVIKPPLKAPISTIYLWRNVVHRAVIENGGPKNCINIIVGNSKKIFDEWADSPKVNDIIYFGDSETGLALAKQAHAKDKKMILELSGNDMLFVWKDADIESAVEALSDGFLGSTQICMVPKKAFIHEAIYDQFLDKFIASVKKLKVGLPSDPEATLTPVLKIKEFNDFLADALSKGAELCLGGSRVNHKGLPDSAGMYLQPTVLKVADDSCASSMKVIKYENFFPLIPVVRVSGVNDSAIFEKIINFSNNNEYGLRISVWTKTLIPEFISSMPNSGLLRINCRHVGFSMYSATHGGTKKTGGAYGEMNYVWLKTSHAQGVTVSQ